MIQIKLQTTTVSALGFGTWKLRGEDCVTAVRHALDVGYRHFDTAQIYENEEDVGTALKDSGIPRSEIFLTTKVWMDRVRDGVLQKSVDESLRKLKTDYVDLLLIHWPVKDVLYEEQMRALNDVYMDSKTKLMGVSNFTVSQMQIVRETIGAQIVNNQVEYHPYLSQKPVLDYVRSNGMFLTAYSPLARGKVNESTLLQHIAHKYGKNPGQVALRWLLQQQNVAAIPKAATPAHIEANFHIFDFTLGPEEMDKISALARPDGRMVNPDWAPFWDKAA